MRLFFFLGIFLINVAYTQQINDTSPNTYRFNYGFIIFKGSKSRIVSQLKFYKESPDYQSIPEEIRTELDQLYFKTIAQVYPRRFKKKAIAFLKAYDTYKAFILFYNTKLYEVIRKLRRDIDKIDFQLEKEFTKAKIALDRIRKEEPLHKKTETLLEEDYYISHIRLLCHRWMRKKFKNYTTIRSVQKPDALILEFKKKQASKMFSFFQEDTLDPVNNYLENQIIDFYYKKAILEIDIEGLELLYINKL